MTSVVTIKRYSFQENPMLVKGTLNIKIINVLNLNVQLLVIQFTDLKVRPRISIGRGLE